MSQNRNGAPMDKRSSGEDRDNVAEALFPISAGPKQKKVLFSGMEKSQAQNGVLRAGERMLCPKITVKLYLEIDENATGFRWPQSLRLSWLRKQTKLPGVGRIRAAGCRTIAVHLKST